VCGRNCSRLNRRMGRTMQTSECSRASTVITVPFPDEIPAPTATAWPDNWPPKQMLPQRGPRAYNVGRNPKVSFSRGVDVLPTRSPPR
jgi:hypothetical protein